MSAWLDLAWMFVMIGMLSWITGNLLAMVLVYAVSPSALRHERRQLWFLAALPSLLPIITLLTIAALIVAKKLSWVVDHCLFHDQHHPHFCLTHLPELSLSLPQSLVAIISVALLLTTLIWHIVSLLRQHHLVRSLCQLAGTSGMVNELNDERPMAFTTGIRNPTVFLSSGLKKCLNKHQQRIVVAHEFAHIRHQDVALNTLYEFLLTFHIVRKPLRYRWYVNTECLADSQVSQRFDPLDVATVLLTLARYSVHNPTSASIAGADPQLRIQRLLYPATNAPTHGAFRGLIDWLFWSGIAMTVFVITLNHHAVETLVGWLLTL